MATNGNDDASLRSGASSQSSGSSSNSSDHSSRGNDWSFPFAKEILYDHKHVRYHNREYSQAFSLETPRGANEVWNDIVCTLEGITGQPPSQGLSDCHLARFEDAMRNRYEHGMAFSHCMFAALHQCLDEEFPLMDGNDPDELIMFKHSESDHYNIGIVKEAFGSPQPSIKCSGFGNESIRSHGSTFASQVKLDHCCFVLKTDCKDNEEYLEWLSAVELRLDDENLCSVFSNHNNINQSLDLAGRHGAIAHVLYYAMEWVVPSHASTGQLGNNIPWAVIVGKKVDPSKKRHKTKKFKLESNRWVSGKIHVPEACGFPYTFEVTGCEKMEENDDGSIQNAISAYLETILFGLRAALGFKNAPKPVRFLPASGRVVKVGNQELNVTLRSSATIGRYPCTHPNDVRKWNICQGEIFTGRLNVHHLERYDRHCFLIFNNDDKEVDVVVKVASLAVHNRFTYHDRTLDALEEIIRDAKPRYVGFRRSHRPVKLDLSNVLLATFRTVSGFVTIAADLSKQGYKPLRPQYSKVPLSVLWAAFQELVERVLIPMAELDIIHPRIRFGYNHTSSLLYKVEGEGASQRALMQVIDFERVSLFRLGNISVPRDWRYVQPDHDWNAFTFVLHQCVTLAFAWKEKLTQAGLKRLFLPSLLRSGPEFPAWLEPFRVLARNKKLTKQNLVEALFMLGELFSN